MQPKDMGIFTNNRNNHIIFHYSQNEDYLELRKSYVAFLRNCASI